MHVKENEIKKHLEIILRRKWLVVTSLFLCVGVALYIAFTTSPLYRSTTLILVEGQKIPESYVKPTVTTSIQERLKTIKQQIMSRTRLEKIIDEYNLYTYKPKKSALFLKRISNRFGFLKRLGLDKWEKPLTRNEQVERMRRDIQVEVNGKDAFTLSYVGRDPETTMNITNTLASFFIEENLKVREEYVVGTTNFLENELRRARKELEKKEKAVLDFKKKHKGALPEQLETNLRTLDRLQLELQSTRNTLGRLEEQKMILQERLADLKKRKQSIKEDDGEMPVAVDPLEQELNNLRNQLISLKSVYKDNYPDVQIVKARINEIEAILDGRKSGVNIDKGGDKDKINLTKKVTSSDPYMIQSTLSNVLSQLKMVNTEIDSLKKAESRLKKQIRKYERRVERTPTNEQNLTELLRDYNMMQKHYQSLLSKKLDAMLSANLEKKQKGEQFRVLDPANFPEKPFRPDKKKIIFLGVLAGLGLGLGLTYTLEYLYPVFHTTEDITEIIDLPVLVTIPRFSSKILKKSV